MDTLLKKATTAELHDLMETISQSADITSKQVDLLCAVMDELTERGELPSISAEEITAALKRQESKLPFTKPQSNNITESSWINRAIDSARAERKSRKKARLRVAFTSLSIVLVAILINTGAALAFNRNYLGEFFEQVGQAFVSIFAGNPSQDLSEIHPDMVPLFEQLNELDISVNLPTWIPEEYSFKAVEVIVDIKPYKLAAWFEKAVPTSEFTIMIDENHSDISTPYIEADIDSKLPPITHGDTVYTFIANEGRIKVIWSDGVYQLTLQGDISYEEAEAVIRSIEE